MHVKLKVLRGASAGKEVAVRGDKFFIGRAPECHLRANSDAISRRHCAITASDQQIAIRDLGSRNGTLVNGERISGITDLKVGDQLRIGPLEFLVTYVRPVKSASEKVAQPSSSSATEDDEMAGLIGDWLSEGDELDKSHVPGGETREYRLDETDRIDAPKVERTAEQQAAEAKSKEASKRPEIRPTPSRNTKQAPKDTQEAAAQTLRKFFNRGS